MSTLSNVDYQLACEELPRAFWTGETQGEH